MFDTAFESVFNEELYFKVVNDLYSCDATDKLKQNLVACIASVDEILAF